MTAWRRVGIAGNVLKPELIDRSEFIDQAAAVCEVEAQAATDRLADEPSSPKQLSLEQLAKTPPGTRTGTVAAERGKAERLLDRAKQLEAELEGTRTKPFDPAGILVATVAQKPPSKSRKRARYSDKHGSMTMQGVREERDEREEVDDAAAAAVAARKEEAAAKKQDAAQEKAELEASFGRCEVKCCCGRRVETCKWAGWERCATCGAVKKGKCRVQACKEARGPLLLTLMPPSGAEE